MAKTLIVSATPPAAERAAPHSRFTDGFSSPWTGFAVRRLGGLVLAFFVITTITFLIVPLIPGDPAVSVAGPNANSAEIDAIRTRLGLDLPLWQQYFTYLGRVLTGDLGTSFMWGRPVWDLVLGRLSFTAPLAFIAMALVLVIGIPLGMVTAVLTRGGRNRWLDTGFGWLTGLFSTTPSYVLATVLILPFAIGLGLVPPAFSRSDVAASAILPIVALSIGPICTIARVVRRETETVMEQDYIRTARGWRIPSTALYLRYLLPNIFTVTLTLGGLVLTSLLGGTIIVETVFAWPGLGTAIVAAIINRDYPLIQGIILVLGILATLVNLFVDIALGLVDSRTLGGKNVR
ncbi:ABC transporter permease [Streptomyces phaeochromogenes]|uniref:ABC transporter permease n=1 Tax=Streptomyces phaeochromogenes TaxID=1923 RepID=UPI002DDC88ED|nr:ABC transporter permease [Streptomyces phaeochromogenes]WRZ34543.1 ABC transporter permease [Streptomyces phaeochromogenes]